MSKFTILAVTLIVALSCIYDVDGHKCYNCLFAETNGKKLGQDSCSPGNKPNSGLSEDCSLDMEIPISDDFTKGIQVSNKTVTISGLLAARGITINQDEITDWSCFKLSADGSIDGTFGKVIIRSCLPIISYDSNATIHHGLWPVTAADASSGFNIDFSVSGKMCTGENCNSALSSVTISLAVMMGSIAVVLFSNLI